MSSLIALAKSVVFAVLFLAAFGQSSLAQEKHPTDQSDVVRVSTELVQTDVRVFDKQGHFVEGLTPEQFALRLEGRIIPISFFERVRAGSGRDLVSSSVSALSAETKSPADFSYRGRTVIFFIDDLHLSPTSLEITRGTLQRFLTRSMQENDQLAIASASGQIGFLQQFTDNKTVLRAAIDRLKYLPVNDLLVAQVTGPTMSEYMALTIERKDDPKVLGYYVTECMKRQNTGRKSGRMTTDIVRIGCETQVINAARMILQQSASITLRTYDALMSLMRSSEAMPGSKLAFFISDGFLLDSAGRGPDTRERLHHITDAATRSGVVIYSIDAKGLSGNLQDATNNVFDTNNALASVRMRELWASQDALHALAYETGGRALRNQNTYDAFVNKVLEETSNYYLLAWRPPNEEQKKDKFQEIEVSVVGRPNLVVRAPRGFYSTGLAARSLPAADGNIKAAEVSNKSDAALRRAFSDSVAKNNFPIQLSLAYLDTPNNGALLVSSMQTATSELSYTTDGNRNAALDVAGIIVDDKGKSVGSFRTRLNVSPLNNDAEHQDDSSVIYNHRAPIKPGIYQVRVAARDDRSGRVGSARQWIEIPDLGSKRLTLSSLLLGGKVVESNPKHLATTALPEQVQFSVDRHFVRGSHFNVLTFIYNAARSANGTGLPDLEVQLNIFRGAQPIVRGTLRKVRADADTDLGRIMYAADSAVQTLPPGRYLLQVTIFDRIAKTNASQQINFEIE